MKFNELLDAFNGKSISEADFIAALTTNKVEKDTAISLVNGIAKGLKPAVETAAWLFMENAFRTSARANMVKTINAYVSAVIDAWLKADSTVHNKKAKPRQHVAIVNYFTGVITPVETPADFDLTARAYLADSPCKGHSFLNAIVFDRFLKAHGDYPRPLGLLIISESYSRKGYNYTVRDADNIRVMRKNYAIWQSLKATNLQSGAGDYILTGAGAGAESTGDAAGDAIEAFDV